MWFSRYIVTVSLLTLSLATTPIETSLRVNTTSGLIVGHQAPNRTRVAEFLGIKYAAAPMGELRFAPPRRFAAPPGTFYKASKWVSD
ncbi:hypothetical protein PG993_011160 [Apiospora rasikravindrae]|uniref:Carboxylesterase type B domain-containing protein n=1 Tax=Apiospora rasikravindrae TaxID=990691 RepID=A0ABR1SDE9_9PEZI